MDTALVNSWYEVVRLTDPLIWTLAKEGSSIPSDVVHDTLLPQAQKPSKHHPHHCRRPHRQSASPTMALSSRDHLSPSTSSHHTHHDNYCRALLDPHPRHSLDWLKCLMQTSHHHAATASGEEQDHSRQLRTRNLRLMLGTHVDFGLAGEGIMALSLFFGTFARLSWVSRNDQLLPSKLTKRFFPSFCSRMFKQWCHEERNLTAPDTAAWGQKSSLPPPAL